VPEIIAIEPFPGRECCDFCCVESTHKIFACKNFVIPDLGPVSHESIGAWAACEECARLVDGGKWSELTERALAQFKRIHGYSACEEPFFRERFREIHLLFRENLVKES
jgi:hypothetical protein